MFGTKIRSFSTNVRQSCFFRSFSLQSKQLQPDYVSNHVHLSNQPLHSQNYQEFPSKTTSYDIVLQDLKLVKQGKVRDIYDLGDNLLMVASDRLSAFDVILPDNSGSARWKKLWQII